MTCNLIAEKSRRQAMPSELEILQSRYNAVILRCNQQAEYIEVAELKIEQDATRIDELEMLLAMAQTAHCEE